MTPTLDNRNNGFDITVDEMIGTHALRLDSNSTKDNLGVEEKKLIKSDVLKSTSIQPCGKNLFRRRRAKSDLTPTATKFDVSELEKRLVSEVPATSAVDTSATPWSSSSSWARVGRIASDEKWHDIKERKLTPEEERDLRVVENRQHLDPKRFYKSTGTGRKPGDLPTRVHFGTVVVGAHEFYSARMTRRERRSRIIDEVLADKEAVSYIKKKGRTLQVQKSISKRVVDPASRRRR